MILNKNEIKQLYRHKAPYYDAALWLYRFIGVSRCRREAVRALQLQPGETVVDMGCGTGLNFGLLYDAVGPSGRIVGVDLTDGMLEQARRRVRRAGWQNVELVEADLASYAFPEDMNAAIATFVLEMVPAYDAVIRHASEALPQRGRLALFGLREPENWPEWLIHLGVWLNEPFGMSRDYASFHPWESVRRHMREVEHRKLFAGAAYLSVGTAREDER